MPFRLPSFPATRHRLAFLRAGAWLAVLFGGVWLLAGQAWRFVLPQAAPAAARALDPAAVAEAVAGRHFFGVAAPRAAPAASSGSYRLLGVIAGAGGQPGLAVLEVNGKSTVAVAAGAEIEPGVLLRAVLPRAIRMEQGGREAMLSLPERVGN